MPPAPRPTFMYEDTVSGPVCGLDEVGRGPLAGPVVAACVVIPDSVRTHPFVSDLQDSKKLTKVKLKILNGLIHQHCHVAIAEHSPAEIDDMNILQASLSAMRMALDQMRDINIAYALVDGNRTPQDLSCPGQALVGGDGLSKSIAAASIVAKFYRDELMVKLAAQYPVYKWCSNVGYGTPEHRAAILSHGITVHHRKSFAPVRNFLMSSKAQKSA